MTRPGIVIVENAVDITGGLISIIRSSQALRDHFTFTFVLHKGSRAKKFIVDAGFTTHEIAFVEIRKNLISILSYVPALFQNTMRFRSLVRKIKPSLIVVNDFYNLIPAAYKMSGGKVPYVCFIRFVPSRFPKLLVTLWTNANLKHAAKVIAVSKTVLKDCPDNDKIIQIYDPLPDQNIAYEPNEDATTILCLANFIEGKGQQHVLKAFAKISDEFPLWKIRFVGSDMGLQKNKDYKKILIGISQSLGLDKQVEWHEGITDLTSIYTSSSFTVNFSESESFSLTCMESLYAGRTVIATRSGGPAEIIDDTISGMLVNRGDHEAMACAMKALIANTELRNKMSAEAYSRIRIKFAAKNTYEKLEVVYFSLLGQHKGNQKGL